MTLLLCTFVRLDFLSNISLISALSDAGGQRKGGPKNRRYTGGILLHIKK